MKKPTRAALAEDIKQIFAKDLGFILDNLYIKNQDHDQFVLNSSIKDAVANLQFVVATLVEGIERRIDDTLVDHCITCEPHISENCVCECHTHAD